MASHAETTDSLLPEYIYHIYNRGVSGKKIFFEERNYYFFFQRYSKYLSNYLDTYAYCLLPNHFHFLVKVKSAKDIIAQLPIDYEKIPKGLKNKLFLEGIHLSEDMKLIINTKGEIQAKICAWFVSNQFRRFFLSYSKALNSQENKHGNLFQKPFKRKVIESESHLKNLIWYIHRNPVHHEVYADYTSYPFSSYQSLLHDRPAKLVREEVMKKFDGVEGFLREHEEGLEKYLEKENLLFEG